MVRRISKHPALRKEIEKTSNILLAADNEFQAQLMELVPSSLTRLKKLLDSKSDSVALSAIKHLHVLVGLAAPVSAPVVQTMTQVAVNMFGEHNGDPPIYANGKVIDRD